MAQTSLGKFGYLDWSNWLYGLFSGAISGGANSVYAGFSSILVDSKDFNIYDKKLYILMGITFGLSALMATMNYLHTKPLPTIIQTETTTKRVEIEATDAKPIPPPPVITTTEKVTKVEPVVSEKKD